MLASVADDEKMLLVYYHTADGLPRLDVFPESVYTDSQNVRGQLRVTTVNDTAFCYNEATLDSVAIRRFSELTDRMATIVQWKLNNKYNDQVFTDVVATITGDSLITARVGAIGKWLTPSVKLSDDSARLYMGSDLQASKQSRHRFNQDIFYTVALPRQRVYSQVLVKEAVYDDVTDEFLSTPMALDASMFSSNLPGRDGEGFAQMLDGDINTFYHSTWDVSSDEKQRIYDTEPYLDMALLQSVRRIRFSYTTRNNDGYAPLALALYASNDGESWTAIRTFTAEADGLPTGAAATYESPIVDLAGNYTHLRLLLTKSSRRRYLVLSEFRLWDVAENPDYHGAEVLTPAEYAYQMMPFGRRYRAHVDWLTDQPTVRVPRINIDIENGEMVSSKDYYLNATISIDGGGVFPSMGYTPVQIKGRGNSSWNGWWPWDKNPYRLKFAEKQKPFGLTKGKNWVLLANKQTGSMTSNAIGMKAACLVGTAGANHIVPVELYINGDYRGNYNFTEKVGLSNNSIDFDDETQAALLELDTYFDEAYKFRSRHYSLPVNIKKPDFSEGTTSLTQTMIETDFNQFMQVLKEGRDIADVVDIDMLARYLLVNDLICNYELHHPKSTFLHKERVGDSDSKFVFGPVWDLDWAFGYERGHSYFQSDATSNYWTAVNMEARQFIYDLRFVSKTLDKAYYQLWTQFLGQPLDELIDFCDDYYAYARPSLENNATVWGDGNTYDRATTNAKSWLRRRAEYIYSRLTAYEIDPDEQPTDDLAYRGDADGIEVLTPHSTSHDPQSSLVDVYDLNGRLVKRRVSVFDLRTGLQPGLYIVGGKKMVVP